MTHSSDSDEAPHDDIPEYRLSRSLHALPIPPTPPTIASRVHGRLKHRSRRRILLGGVGIGLLILPTLWRVPEDRSGTLISIRPPARLAEDPAEALRPDELTALFAPPPVDPLAILARQDALLTLNLSRPETTR